MAFDKNRVWALHIAPGGPPPEDKPLPWNFRCSFMNRGLPGKEVHIDSRKPLEADWWKDYPDVKRLEIHGDLPGGFDAVRHFSRLRELIVYDSASLECLTFIRELDELEIIQIIRCPYLEDVGPIADLMWRQYKVNNEKAEDKRFEWHASLEAVCINECGIKDLSPLEGLDRRGVRSLQELNLRGNRIEDVSPLAHLWVHYLDLSRNQIEDIRPIYPLIRRGFEVYLNDNRIRDISGLTADLEEERRRIPGLPARAKLWLGNNAIPKEQLRESEDHIRDIDPSDISPAKLKWMEKKYDAFMWEYDRRECGDGEGSHTTVRYTERSLDDCDELERRPTYSIRGKPVPRQTALEIIRRTDGYLHEFMYPGLHRIKSDTIEEIFARHGTQPFHYYPPHVYPMQWFPKPGEPCYGWCHPDGYIGADDFSHEKNPFLYEMLEYWVFIIENITTELDMVVGVAHLNEVFDPNRPIADQLYSGYHIKGDTITLLDTAQVKKLYREYDGAYGDHELRDPLTSPKEGMLTELHDGCWVLDSDGIDKGIWNRLSASAGIDPRWETPRTSHSPGLLYQLIWGLNGRVSKNHMCYYGVPDYRFETSPLTLRDLEDFAIRFRKEQDEREEQDE